MQEKVDELTESPPRAGLDCFREAIQHATDEALRQAVYIPAPPEGGPEREGVLRLMRARRRLLTVVDMIEREETA